MTGRESADEGSSDAAATEGADRSGGTVSRRTVLRSGLGAMAATPVLAASAGRAAPGPEGPSGVHTAFGVDPSTTMNVGFTGVPGGDPVVEYGRPGGSRTTVAAYGRVVPGMEAMAYEATLRDLSPDTTYEYVVRLDGRTAGPYEFTTAPAAGEPFRVSAVGDHGIEDPDNPFALVETAAPERVFRAARSRDPDLQLLTGDIAYADGDPTTWELYFETFEGYLASTPFMTAPGNHEAEPGTGMAQYDRRLNALMPTDGLGDLEHKQRWYAFDYGNTRFVSLSTTADTCGDAGRAEEAVPLYDPRCEAGGVTYGAVQERFLRATLADAARDDDLTWTVVYFHGPLWTDVTDRHAPRRDLRARWGPILDAYGVDLVLSGDNHVYERTKPIAARPGREDYAPESAWDHESRVGTTFVTNGTGGAGHYGFPDREPSDFLARRTNAFFGVTELDIDDERIRVEYVTDAEGPDGDRLVADAFEIRKSGRRTATGARYPMQVDRVDAVAKSLSVSGSRTDDGSLFTGGQTDTVTLSFEASHPVAIRDRIPAAWDVVGGDAVRTEPALESTQWVYFDGSPRREGSVSYLVEVPEGAANSGPYTLGPFHAFAPAFGEWMAVAGTESREVVVGVGTDY